MMNIPNQLIYTGDDKYQPPAEGIDIANRRCYPYFPSADLTEAVNLAIALERPLLLEGEPGCGKSQLADAIAHEFSQRHLKENLAAEAKPWPFYVWYIKSTSRSKDGLYTFDAVRRLRDAQMSSGSLDKKELKRLKEAVQNPKKYRRFGPLGNALRDKFEPEDQPETLWQNQCRSILLIDEIDKADSDFPNDLLRELDEMSFDIPETDESFPRLDEQGQPITPKRPIIIITSNQDKPLPEAFLRRCIYFYVEFPDEELLRKIIANRFDKKNASKTKLIDLAIKRFQEIHQFLKAQTGSRSPGTSEFIDFLEALFRIKNSAAAIRDLNNLSIKLPLLGTLIKSQADQKEYQDFVKRPK